MSTTVSVKSIHPDKGSLAGNNLITLKGSGFNNIIGKPAVNFGEAGGLKVTVVSDKKITVVNPNTGKSGTVKVTLINGKTNIPAGTFDYKLPEVTGVHPRSSSLAGQQKVTIHGKYFTGAKAVNFKKMGASEVHVISDSKITVINPAAPKTEKVNVTVIVQGQSSVSTKADQFLYTTADDKSVPLLFSANSLKDTYIQFLGDVNLKGSYYDSTGKLKTLEPNTAYSLHSITSSIPVAKNIPNNVPAVLIKSFSGRVYASLGSGLTGMSPSYIPNADVSTGHNGLLRYQYFEPTIKNSQLNVDLSYIDFTSISLSLKAINAPHSTNSNQTSQSSLKLATATGAAASKPNGSVLPSSSDQLPSPSFERVISPQLGANGLYHDFTHYLKTVLKNKSVRIAGTFVGVKQQPSGNPLTQAQSYDYTATFDSDGNVTLVPNKGSGDGKAKGIPAKQQGPGVEITGGDINITFADLNKNTGIYGCNPSYTYGKKPKTKTHGIENNFYGQVVGDLLAGLNFGYVGSTQRFQGGLISDLASTEWWGGIMPNGTVVAASSTPGGTGIYFSGVQSKPENYNSYAGSIDNLTTGYGFPLQDRLGDNLLTINSNIDPDGYLKVFVDIEP